MPDQPSSERPRLRPVLAPLQVGSLALGCVIGFGCFILAGDFLETAGPLGAALGIALGGLAMVVIARSYGRMVRAFPVAGAEFAYAYRAAGRHHAVICGWFLALGYLSIVPLNATALAVLGKFLAPELFARGYLYQVAGFEVFAGEVALAAFAVVLVGFLHSRGVEGVGRSQAVMTGLMVAAVALVGLGALTGPGASVANWEPWFAPGRSAWTGVLAMVAISPWLYVGFDTLPQAAEEFAFPAGKAFRLMAAAILAGAGMYVVVLLATGVVLPWRELVAGEPVWATGATVRASLGTAGVAILSVAVVTAIFTGINGFFMASSRLLFSMGRARLLPAWFGSIDPDPRHAAERAAVHRGGVAARALVRPRGHRLGGGHGRGRHRLRLPVHLSGGVFGDAAPARAGGSGARRAPVGRVPGPPLRSRDARVHGAALVDRAGRLDRARRAVLLPARPGVRGDSGRRAGHPDPRGSAGPPVAARPFAVVVTKKPGFL